MDTEMLEPASVKLIVLSCLYRILALFPSPQNCKPK